jgi:lipopolysaccharide exporter
MIRKIVRQFVGGSDSLRQRAIFGSNWLMLKSLVGFGLDLVRAAIFARVLSPSDYGLQALAMTGVGLWEAFSSTGIEIMVQRDDDNYREKLAGYWTIKCIRGILLTSFAWIVAVPVAQFYNNPDLIPLIRFLGVSFLLKGLTGFGREIRERNLEFGRLAVVDIISGITILAVGLVVLFMLANVWALAIYVVLSSVSALIISYLLFPWRPKIRFDRVILKEVAIFAGSVVLLNIFNYVFTNFDIGVIGKLRDITDVGYYARGNFLGILPATYFAVTISPVLLPAFRSMGNDNARLRRAFLKTLLTYAVFFTAMGLCMFVLSKLIVIAVYGRKWLAVVPVFNILIIYGVSKSIIMATPSIFYLKGKPWLMALCGSGSAAVLLSLCVPLTVRFGIIGTAWAVVIAGCTSHVVLILLALRLLSPGSGSRSSSQDTNLAEPNVRQAPFDNGQINTNEQFGKRHSRDDNESTADTSAI